MDVFIDFLDWVLSGLTQGIIWLLDLLPVSPFASWRTDPPPEVNLGYITWFIPFPTMLVHFAGFLVVVGVYYLYRVLGRWLKVVRN
jgi:hypothetical protein